MPHLALLATGGTIATRVTPAGRDVALGADELLEAAGSPAGARVTARDVAGRLSFAASLDDVTTLAATVHAAAREHDGVVVTHGTDTLEETAFVLALTASGTTPISLTGAQRPADDAAPDGPGNVASALRWVGSRTAVGTGVTVVFAEKVWPAVGVRKVHSLALPAFSAPDRGPLARVDETGVHHHADPRPAGLLDPGAPDDPVRLPRVDVVAQYVDADAAALEAAVAAGARGLVIAAFGAGNTTPPVTAAVRRLLGEGVPVAITSRTGAGPTTGLYAGGGADLARAGALFAGDLSPWQARLLLAAALVREGPRAGVADVAGCARDWMAATGVAGDYR